VNNYSTVTLPEHTYDFKPIEPCFSGFFVA